jgi:NitT/TauT family transport system substrate-binding protein
MTSKFTFYLDWIICAQFAGLCWAYDRGLYKAHGLDVTLQAWEEDGRTIIQKVLTGGICAGSSEDNLIVSAADSDGSVKAFGAMLQETPLVLMSRREKHIRTLQHLRGKRIGMHGDGRRALDIVLALEGIDRNDLSIEQVTFDLEHLHQDRFDAQQGYVMTEPIQLEAMGITVDMLAIRHPRFHPYAQVYFAGSEVLRQSGDVLARFLAASSAGWRDVLAHTDEAAGVVARMMGDPSQAPQQHLMLKRMLPLVAGNLSHEEIGMLQSEQWQCNLATYFEHGVTKRHLELGDVVDTSFLTPLADARR